MADLHCCTAETNTTLYSNYPPIEKKEKKKQKTETRKPRKWSRDVRFYTKICALPSLVWNHHWEAAAQAGTTFPSTPSIHMAM